MSSSPFLDWLMAMFTNVMVGIIQAIATLFWWLEKAAAFFANFFTSQNLWDSITDPLLAALRNLMPGVFETLVLGDGTEPGLLYIAWMLAGLVMIIPRLRQKELLVSTEQVLLNAFLIIALFTSAAGGFDLIELAEDTRQWASQTVIAATSTDGLGDLVADPMQATPEELDSWDFALPLAFEESYFPDISDTYTEDVVLLDSTLGQIAFTLEIETEASRLNRLQEGSNAIIISSLTLVPAYILLQFAMTFAALTAAALALVLFFLAALPLGFFQFGQEVLSRLVQQYAYIFVLTIVATLFPGILLAVGTLTFGGSTSLADLMAYIPLLIVVSIAVGYILKLASSAMRSSFGAVSGALMVAAASQSALGNVPQGGGMPGSGLAKAAGAAALIAATGGLGGAGASKLAIGASMAGGKMSPVTGAMLWNQVNEREAYQKEREARKQNNVFTSKKTADSQVIDGLIRRSKTTPDIDISRDPESNAVTVTATGTKMQRQVAQQLPSEAMQQEGNQYRWTLPEEAAAEPLHAVLEQVNRRTPEAQVIDGFIRRAVTLPGLGVKREGSRVEVRSTDGDVRRWLDALLPPVLAQSVQERFLGIEDGSPRYESVWRLSEKDAALPLSEVVERLGEKQRALRKSRAQLSPDPTPQPLQTAVPTARASGEMVVEQTRQQQNDAFQSRISQKANEINQRAQANVFGEKETPEDE